MMESQMGTDAATVANYTERMEERMRNELVLKSDEELQAMGARFFRWRPKPKGVRWGRENNCHANASRLALTQSERFTLVQGVAGRFRIEHSWCIDSEGFVVENTWRGERGTEGTYLGIVIPFPDLYALIKEHGVYRLWVPEFYPRRTSGGGAE